MKKEISRRDFLNGLWALLGAAAVAELSFTGLRFLAPQSVEGEFGGVFNLGDPAQYPAGSVTPVEAGRFYLVRLPEGGFLAVYRRCTHLGCSVPFDQGTGQFVCPCHGSAFTMEGDVQNAPAPRPLDLFPVSITDQGTLQVDTSQPIERDHITLDHVVYL
jgi:cytochrome b6-f complex iron-sulfur subunit